MSIACLQADIWTRDLHSMKQECLPVGTNFCPLKFQCSRVTNHLLLRMDLKTTVAKIWNQKKHYANGD
jgi:hypothetical protein